MRLSQFREVPFLFPQTGKDTAEKPLRASVEKGPAHRCTAPELIRVNRILNAATNLATLLYMYAKGDMVRILVAVTFPPRAQFGARSTVQGRGPSCHFHRFTPLAQVGAKCP